MFLIRHDSVILICEEHNSAKLYSKSDHDLMKKLFKTLDLTPKEHEENHELKKPLIEMNGSSCRQIYSE